MNLVAVVGSDELPTSVVEVPEPLPYMIFGSEDGPREIGSFEVLGPFRPAIEDSAVHYLERSDVIIHWFALGGDDEVTVAVFIEVTQSE
jgi:hypothetical protein